MADGDVSRLAQIYDALAPEYEHQLAENPVAEYMRAQLHSHFSRIFAPGERVLDLAAGTGLDACYLSSLGVEVIAIDASRGMIDELEGAAKRMGASIEARVLPVERLSELALTNIDGVISTFGGLNTVQALPELKGELARIVRPGGHVVFHALSDFCLWQTVRQLTRGHVEISRRAGIQLGGHVVIHRFYNPHTLSRDDFADSFECSQLYALSVLAAPPLVKRLRGAAPALFATDRILGRMLPTAGDFFVLDLQRRG